MTQSQLDEVEKLLTSIICMFNKVWKRFWSKSLDALRYLFVLTFLSFSVFAVWRVAPIGWGTSTWAGYESHRWHGSAFQSRHRGRFVFQTTACEELHTSGIIINDGMALLKMSQWLQFLFNKQWKSNIFIHASNVVKQVSSCYRLGYCSHFLTSLSFFSF